MTRRLLVLCLLSVAVAGLATAVALTSDSDGVQDRFPGTPLVPVGSRSEQAVYAHEGLGLSFAMPADWTAVDRGDLFADANVATRFKTIIDLRAPVNWVPESNEIDTDGVGTLRSYGPAFDSMDKVRTLCIECNTDDVRPIELGDGSTAEQFTVLIDARFTRTTLWKSGGVIYELKTDDRHDIIGANSQVVHQEIIESIEHT